ncbi:hypothetical protein Y032_0032g2562 [Ancylostoma ceylanicum]|uniref:Uncharacterized protein n=1 Tax=Ancylostoma ceylanicum TaxID=53326 RepID=A0A016UQX9_9BILA|nr:hypothetical protein Y032_0032g2562 [Ancylostoma ceylanicum]
MEDISGGCLVFQSVGGNEYKSFDNAPNYIEIHFLAAIFFVTLLMDHPLQCDEARLCKNVKDSCKSLRKRTH